MSKDVKEDADVPSDWAHETCIQQLIAFYWKEAVKTEERDGKTTVKSRSHWKTISNKLMSRAQVKIHPNHLKSHRSEIMLWVHAVDKAGMMFNEEVELDIIGKLWLKLPVFHHLAERGQHSGPLDTRFAKMCVQDIRPSKTCSRLDEEECMRPSPRMESSDEALSLLRSCMKQQSLLISEVQSLKLDIGTMKKDLESLHTAVTQIKTAQRQAKSQSSTSFSEAANAAAIVVQKREEDKMSRTKTQEKNKRSRSSSTSPSSSSTDAAPQKKQALHPNGSSDHDLLLAFASNAVEQARAQQSANAEAPLSESILMQDNSDYENDGPEEDDGDTCQLDASKSVFQKAIAHVQRMQAKQPQS